MDEQTVLTIFVAIAALAMLIQAATLLAIAVVSYRAQAKLDTILPDLTKLIGLARKSAEKVDGHIDKLGAQIEKITAEGGAAVVLAKQQLVKIDELLDDATTRAKVQMERAELVLDDTMGRVQQTVAIVHSGVMRPIREMHGILVGIRTTFAYLGRMGRPTVDHATSDEEMFI